MIENFNNGVEGGVDTPPPEETPKSQEGEISPIDTTKLEQAGKESLDAGRAATGAGLGQMEQAEELSISKEKLQLRLVEILNKRDVPITSMQAKLAAKEKNATPEDLKKFEAAYRALGVKPKDGISLLPGTLVSWQYSKIWARAFDMKTEGLSDDDLHDDVKRRDKRKAAKSIAKTNKPIKYKAFLGQLDAFMKKVENAHDIILGEGEGAKVVAEAKEEPKAKEEEVPAVIGEILKPGFKKLQKTDSHYKEGLKYRAKLTKENIAQEFYPTKADEPLGVIIKSSKGGYSVYEGKPRFA